MESPCINVCVIDKDAGLCEGCGRSIKEIAAWSRLSPADRRRIMDGLEARKAKAGLTKHVTPSKVP
jgi:uncharacterized protein